MPIGLLLIFICHFCCIINVTFIFRLTFLYIATVNTRVYTFHIFAVQSTPLFCVRLQWNSPKTGLPYKWEAPSAKQFIQTRSIHHLSKITQHNRKLLELNIFFLTTNDVLYIERVHCMYCCTEIVCDSAFCYVKCKLYL